MKKKVLSFVLALCLLVGCLPLSASALSSYYSNHSAAYKSSKYYSQLSAVNLTGNYANDIVAVALSQKGYHEANSTAGYGGGTSGSSNYCEYNRNYWGRDASGSSYAWCTIFVMWCARQARISTSIIPNNLTTVTKGTNNFYSKMPNYNAVRHSSSGYTPQKGDLLITGDGNHIGIVTANASGGKVTYISGNINNCVDTRTLNVSSAKAYITPNYGENTITPTPVPTPAPTVNTLMDNFSIPSAFAQGINPIISGIATSNYTITWIWVGIKKADADVRVLEAQTNPMAYSYDITNLTKDMDFSNLPVGNYTFRVEATSGNKYHILASRDFSVLDSNVTLSGLNVPANIIKGSSLSVQGNLSSSLPITWVWTGVTKGSNKEHIIEADWGTGSVTAFDISQPASKLDFTKLPIGEYNFCVEGIAGGKYFVAIEQPFSVIDSTPVPTPTPEPIQIVEENEVGPTPEVEEVPYDPTPENSFIDVPNGAYFADAVNWAVAKGITAGTSSNTFSPNQVCTRAQAVTFLWRAAGSPEPSGSSTKFVDVASGQYYTKAVQWAVEKGITGGTSATTFSPNDKCTRAQIVTFQYRMHNSPSVSRVSPFADVPPTLYYANAVAWAVENGITSGTSASTFGPHNDCSRGQIVTFLYRDMA